MLGRMYYLEKVSLILTEGSKGCDTAHAATLFLICKFKNLGFSQKMQKDHINELHTSEFHNIWHIKLIFKHVLN